MTLIAVLLLSTKKPLSNLSFPINIILVWIIIFFIIYLDCKLSYLFLVLLPVDQDQNFDPPKIPSSKPIRVASTGGENTDAEIATNCPSQLTITDCPTMKWRCQPVHTKLSDNEDRLDKPFILYTEHSIKDFSTLKTTHSRCREWYPTPKFYYYYSCCRFLP
jgi:hypothetical protein